VHVDCDSNRDGGSADEQAASAHGAHPLLSSRQLGRVASGSSAGRRRNSQ
jgi:hypothetical protein